jgi:hypothetical protein
MIISKVQGQSLNELGVDLREELFHMDSYVWIAQMLVLQKAYVRVQTTGAHRKYTKCCLRRSSVSNFHHTNVRHGSP